MGEQGWESLPQVSCEMPDSCDPGVTLSPVFCPYFSITVVLPCSSELRVYHGELAFTSPFIIPLRSCDRFDDPKSLFYPRTLLLVSDL